AKSAGRALRLPSADRRRHAARPSSVWCPRRRSARQRGRDHADSHPPKPRPLPARPPVRSSALRVRTRRDVGEVGLPARLLPRARRPLRAVRLQREGARGRARDDQRAAGVCDGDGRGAELHGWAAAEHKSGVLDRRALVHRRRVRPRLHPRPRDPDVHHLAGHGQGHKRLLAALGRGL
ncbi:hypothetical protein T492DRAFT_910028, partial [Pavlovales sp. CCMP2436]